MSLVAEINRARRICIGILAIAFAATTANAQIPASAYPARRAAALSAIAGDLLIVPARASFLADDQLGFVQAGDFQYLTGLDELVGAVLVLDGSASTSTLFVQPRNPLLTRGEMSPDAASARRLQLTGILPIDGLEPWLRQRLGRSRSTVYVASTDVRGPVTAPLPMAGTVARWQSWLTSLGAGPVKPAIDVLRPLRAIKDANEIAVLRQVGRTSGEAFLAGLRALAPQKWQHETELAVVNACREAGARGISFWPWTMSGPNADFHSLWNSFVSYDHVDRQMQAGEVVRVDVGCQVDHYMGDVGRTAPVSGTFTDGQREAWDLFIAGYRAGLSAISDHAGPKAVFGAALAEVRRQSSSLMTQQGKHAAEILLGPQGTEAWQLHGVGLDDAEGLPEVLRAGMAVAYELMFTVDGDGFYLEDMILVTGGGYEVLTPGLPYTAAEIEASMSKRGSARDR
ncbi:MAG TPA: aminopeptidase P N-terminal domain-containing protein [Vicinamibacterales bacterium]